MGHKACKWQSKDLNPGSLAPDFIFLSIMVSCFQKIKV